MKINYASASFDDQNRDPEPCASSAADYDRFDTTTSEGHVVSYLVSSLAEPESVRIREHVLVGSTLLRAQLQLGFLTLYRELDMQRAERGRAA